MPELDDYSARAHAAEAALDEIGEWILTEEPDPTCCDFCAGYASALADIDAIIDGAPGRLGAHFSHVQTVKIAAEYQEAL